MNDWLIEKRKRWYSYRQQDRTLKAGDHVAVLGIVIGVVASADTNDVHVLMWNKVTLGIPRKRVGWSRQDWRWEGTAAPPDHPWRNVHARCFVCQSFYMQRPAKAPKCSWPNCGNTHPGAAGKFLVST